MTLTIELGRDIMKVHTKIRVRMPNGSARRALNYRQTHTHTHGTDSITSDRCAGGKNRCNFFKCGLIFNPKPLLESSGSIQSKRSRNSQACTLPIGPNLRNFMSRIFYVLQYTDNYCLRGQVNFPMAILADGRNEKRQLPVVMHNLQTKDKFQ